VFHAGQNSAADGQKHSATRSFATTPPRDEQCFNGKFSKKYIIRSKTKSIRIYKQEWGSKSWGIAASKCNYKEKKL